MKIWKRLALAAGLMLAAHGAALAAEARQVVTSKDGDYFGFDLRSEQSVSLEQCKSICLGDQACRAFTYNLKAKWCFLKSDFAVLKPFAGAVAGKVVAVNSEVDIGAPPVLPFFPESMIEEAENYRTKLTDGSIKVGEEGLNGLVEAGDAALAANDPRTAVQKFSAAVATQPDDGRTWLKLARAAVAVQPANGDEASTYQIAGTSAAYNGYRLLRTTPTRADALATLAVALDRREMSRPALQAYEASLALVNAASVRAEYDDLKARKGFRVIEHTVDADTPTPRICAQFSEDLVKTGVDYSTFVTVDDAAPKSVEASGRQICVEGLEHGRSYRVTFRAGLPAAIGEVIQAPVVLSAYIQDRGASVRFTGDNFVLPATARRGIPVVTVNMDVAQMKLYRVGDRALTQLLSGYQFLKQLEGYEINTLRDDLGAPVWQGELAIANQLNQEITTSFPVDQALPERKPGVYVLTAEPKKGDSDSDEGDYSSKATQWFVVSDIGLTTYTGQDGLNVFVRALSSAKSLAGVELTLLARNNEVLGTATTDAEGRAAFNPGLTRGEGGMVPQVLLASRGKDDFVFLDLTRAGFDLSDRGVTGRASPGALDVYAWTERGIYRAGETVHAAALARDDAANAVEKLPLTFIFSRPDGVEDRRIVTDGGLAGGQAVDLPLSASAMRGTWTVSIYTDPKQGAVASQNFLVEDFVPDRIEFDLTSDKPEIAVGEPATLTVDGRFLYGAPAAGLELEGEVTLATKRDWSRFPRYLFGLEDEDQGEATQLPLEDLPAVGDDGKATFPVQVDELPSTTRLVKAGVTVRMRETGGRAVERALDLDVKPQGDTIGIKPASGDVPEGGIAKFSVIAIDKDGNRKDLKGALWSLVKVERNYIWYRRDNSWTYEAVENTQSVASGTIDLAADREVEIAQGVGWGRYRLQVETPDPEGPVTSTGFDAGWYVSASSTETPDGLEIALDKDGYAAGEVAKLKVSPRFAGELLVTVGSDRLLTTVSATIPQGGGTVDIPIGADWGAGGYVTATLFRPGDAMESRMPARAIGVKWLKVDPGAKKLSVALSAPAKNLPRQTLSIPVEVKGAAPGENAYVMVAAVDVGILNLTRYEAPDPESYFFGQRMMGLEIRDLYGRLIDGSLGAAGRLRTGGDGGMSAQGKPPTEKLVAFFEGPVQLDADGRTTISFDLPQFNGTVRIMAVAWTKTALGHATQDVIVRDPVVITAGIPRFLAPGDEATMRLDVANTDGPDGDYQLAIDTTGSVSEGAGEVPQTLTLTGGKRQTLTVPLTAGKVGTGGITVRLTDAGGQAVEQVLSIPVRAPVMPVTTRLVVDLGPNSNALRVDGGLLAGSLIEDASVSVGVTQSAALDVPSLLLALDRYPYGCAEQTTSRALPLLYVSELSQGTGVPNDDAAQKERVQAAIYKLTNFQSSSGSFGLWGPGSGDLFLDAYVTDFLTRAREKGFDVPQFNLNQALANLQNATGYDTDLQSRGREIAYALFVLARNKRAAVGDLRYYADTQLEAFSSPLAVAQLAASLALYGDAERSEATFVAAVQLAKSQTAYDWTRSDYGSRLRDLAAMLSLAAESRPAPSVVPELVKMVSAERARTKWTSTQENVWMLMAARSIQSGNAAIRLDVNGQPYTGAFSKKVGGPELMAAPVTIANRGANPVQAVVTAVASPAEPLPAGGEGFTIERAYYTLDGAEANVSEVEQNQRYVVVLKVTEQNRWPSRIIVNDLLPAGFEIDNPSLVSSASLSNFDWLEQTEAAHLEFRDDRFIAAFDRSADSDRSMTLAYVVRAVTPGTYVHPAATVEDMYRPQYSARTAAGMMAVR